MAPSCKATAAQAPGSWASGEALCLQQPAATATAAAAQRQRQAKIVATVGGAHSEEILCCSQTESLMRDFRCDYSRRSAPFPAPAPLAGSHSATCAYTTRLLNCTRMSVSVSRALIVPAVFRSVSVSVVERRWRGRCREAECVRIAGLRVLGRGRGRGDGGYVRHVRDR